MVRLFFLLVLFSLNSNAQQWPAKPVKIVVPFSPGGFADSGARAVSDKLAARLGQPVLIENKVGASGNIGTEMVAKSPPDGYTLLLAFDGTMVINPHVFAKIPFDTIKDFQPVTKLGDAPVIVVAHPSVQVKNLRELIAAAKAKPNSFSYGTSGTGNTPHLVGEMVNQRAGTDFQHIPYKGGAQALADAVGGQIPLVFTAIASAQQFLHSGRLKALGVTSTARVAALPRAHVHRVGPARLRGQFLGRHPRAGEYPAPYRRPPAARTCRGAQGTGRARALRGARQRTGRQHAGRIRGADQVGPRAMGRHREKSRRED